MVGGWTPSPPPVMVMGPPPGGYVGWVTPLPPGGFVVVGPSSQIQCALQGPLVRVGGDPNPLTLKQ